MRTITARLIDNNGIQLADDYELLASFLVTDYSLTGGDSKLVLHGPQPLGGFNNTISTFTLSDGDILTDGTYELTAKFQIGSRLLHAGTTDTLLHGG